MDTIAGGLGLATRRRLAGKVFALTGAYDSAIASSLLGDEVALRIGITASYRKVSDLRYGENPHQRAAWYVPSSSASFGALSDLVQHQGKELSFNNIRDLDGAWRAVSEFDDTGLCGSETCGTLRCGSGERQPWRPGRGPGMPIPVSIFGGIVVFNRNVDEAAALSLGELFLEVIAAPGYTDGALEVFSGKKEPPDHYR